MRKTIQSDHAQRRTSSQVSFCLVLFLLSLQPLCAATLPITASPVPVQSKVLVVGILSFQDETDSGAPSELGRKVAVQLKQRLALGFKDVLPKLLNSDAPSTAALSVEQAVALGKQNAVPFVVRGGILALAVTESNITAQLYAEIISVESGAVSVVRAQGTGAGGSIQWSATDLNSASFSSSARDPDRTSGSTASQPRSGALRGQVVDALNRRPIAGATVLIAGRRAKTDQAGNYELADLAPGNYQAKVTSSGFSEDQQSVTIRPGASSREEFVLKRLGDSNRTVRAISETPRVATPTRLGQARGRVVDATSGALIAGAV